MYISVNVYCSTCSLNYKISQHSALPTIVIGRGGNSHFQGRGDNWCCLFSVTAIHHSSSKVSYFLMLFTSVGPEQITMIPVIIRPRAWRLLRLRWLLLGSPNDCSVDKTSPHHCAQWMYFLLDTPFYKKYCKWLSNHGLSFLHRPS